MIVQFTRDAISNVTVRGVERGRLRIGDTDYRHTIAIAAGELLEAWESPPLVALTIEHLAPLLARDPDVLLIGCGYAGDRPPRALTFALAKRGIGSELMDTPAACRTFNILVAEDRRPAAIFYID